MGKNEYGQEGKCSIYRYSLGDVTHTIDKELNTITSNMQLGYGTAEVYLLESDERLKDAKLFAQLVSEINKEFCKASGCSLTDLENGLYFEVGEMSKVATRRSKTGEIIRVVTVSTKGFVEDYKESIAHGVYEITLHEKTTYNGLSGYYTKDQSLANVDLSKVGIENTDQYKNFERLYYTQYRDAATGELIRFACTGSTPESYFMNQIYQLLLGVGDVPVEVVE